MSASYDKAGMPLGPVSQLSGDLSTQSNKCLLEEIYSPGFISLQGFPELPVDLGASSDEDAEDFQRWWAEQPEWEPNKDPEVLAIIAAQDLPVGFAAEPPVPAEPEKTPVLVFPEACIDPKLRDLDAPSSPNPLFSQPLWLQSSPMSLNSSPRGSSGSRSASGPVSALPTSATGSSPQPVFNNILGIRFSSPTPRFSAVSDMITKHWLRINQSCRLRSNPPLQLTGCNTTAHKPEFPMDELKLEPSDDDYTKKVKQLPSTLFSVNNIKRALIQLYRLELNHRLMVSPERRLRRIGEVLKFVDTKILENSAEGGFNRANAANYLNAVNVLRYYCRGGADMSMPRKYHPSFAGAQVPEFGDLPNGYKKTFVGKDTWIEWGSFESSFRYNPWNNMEADRQNAIQDLQPKLKALAKTNLDWALAPEKNLFGFGYEKNPHFNFDLWFPEYISSRMQWHEDNYPVVEEKYWELVRREEQMEAQKYATDTQRRERKLKLRAERLQAQAQPVSCH